MQFLKKRGETCENREVVNHLTRLLQTPSVVLERFEHPAHIEHHDPECEVAPRFSMNFVEDGSFRVRPDADRRRRATWHVTPQTLFVTAQGLAYSCRHDQTHPTDRCLSVAFTEAAVDHLLIAGARADTSAGTHAGAWPLTNRHQYLRRHFDTCTRGDELRLDALAADLFFTLTPTESTRAAQPLFRAELLSWYATRVDRARSLMDANYHEPISLTHLAREVGMSPFHFARVFRELAGVPPHRYLTSVRLTHAAQRLREGASVTDTSLAVGFGSLSHFIAAFRRRYGASPSKWIEQRAATARRAAIGR